MAHHTPIRNQVLTRLAALGLSRYRLAVELERANIIGRSVMLEWLRGTPRPGLVRPKEVSLSVAERTLELLYTIEEAHHAD
jgi:hypothetical protein